MPEQTGRVREKARRVRLLCTDVDGVLTDGGMYYSERGDELKKFNTRDGMGTALLQGAGIQVAMITSESTEIVARRAKKLKIEHLFQGAKDKLKTITELKDCLGLDWDEVAYIGDDINDLPLLKAVGLSATVSDGLEVVKQSVAYICPLPGGGGALRDFAELVLTSQDSPTALEAKR